MVALTVFAKPNDVRKVWNCMRFGKQMVQEIRNKKTNYAHEKLSYRNPIKTIPITCCP